MLDILDLLRRVTGRTLHVRQEPAQKGDMRDTFADTSRARADLGFAPSHSLESGLTAECDWMTRLMAVPPR
jgi:nucleoside-diphosphate-sugar epimerase